MLASVTKFQIFVMNKLLERINAWCINHIGILTLAGIIVAIVVPIFVLGLDAQSVHRGIDNIGSVLIYHFSIPLYQILLLLVLGFIFYSRLKKKYRVQSKSQKFLVGVWKNEWGMPIIGQETAKITDDLKYYINGQHFFDLKNFKYDPYKNTIEFLKVGVRENDERKILNTLSVNDNFTLVGFENDYPIKYTKILS